MAGRGQHPEVRDRRPPSKRLRSESTGDDSHQKRHAPAPVVAEHVPPPQPEIIVPMADSISAAVTRYKAWKRAGSVHDSVCFECHKPGNLQHCVTCRRSYHQSCWPEDAVSSSRGDGIVRSYCDVCVNRGWHIESPSLTPPPSPLPQPPSDQALHSTTQFPQQNVPRHPEAVPGPTDGNQDDDTLLPLRGSDSEHRAPQLPGVPPSSSGPSRTSEPTSMEQTTRLPSTSSRGAGRRRSRYATLPTEVDSALRVLYCEVEIASELRQKVTDLEAQLSQLRRELQFRESELALARKAAEMTRASEEEIAQLRAESAQKQGALEEAATLRAKNHGLQAELEATRTKLGEVTQTLQDWKQKLSVLVAD